ncbi:MAG: efflux RND transporter permease subunit [Clostridiales bacterium]|nr:efflux RND transporter permease subunit [Clostridiales bacterium]
MNFSKLSIDRPVTTAMMILIIILVGAVSIIGIPMDLLPDIEMPVAIVVVQYPNAAPEEVETMVTIPLEQSLSSVHNMKSISSMTTEGTSIVMVEFEMKTDMDFAALDMREKISMVEGFLPDDATDPLVIKMSMDFAPVVQVYVSGDKSLVELNKIVEDDILSYFERSPGVASVDIYGGISEEVSIKFDQEKLNGYGLTLSTISQLLAAENINLPSGEVQRGSTKVIVRTLGEFKSVEDIKKIPITLADRSIVHLSDIATIEQGYQEQTSISRVDGKTAIGISIMKQSTANTVEVSNGIAKTIKTLEDRFPDLTFTVGFDQSDYIISSIFSVAESMLLGAILAIIVIFLFLKNINSTLIIAISIPTSIFATFALMNLADMSLNLITLSALTLAVGMLVDNSIVALENIYRLSQQEGYSPYEASVIGSKQIALALSASTLTSVVVFLPIALSSGLSSLLFADFSWTFIIALAVSLLVAITVVPMLCSKMLSQGTSYDYLRIGKRHYRYRLVPYFTRFIDWLTNYYGNVIASSLKNRKKVIIACILIFIISISLIAVVGMEFLPASDEAMFTISVDTPYGTPLEKKNEIMKELENYILTLPELKHCTTDIGQSIMFMGSGSTINVTLVSQKYRDRSIWEIIEDVENEFKDFVGAEISISEASSTTSFFGDSDITLSIKGPELATLREIAEDLGDKLLEIPGVSKTSTSVTVGNPELRVKINRSTAAFYGINAYQLANSLESALTGTKSTNLKVDGNEIAINLSLADTYGTSIDNMKQILIPTLTGTTVPVGQIAEFEFGNSPSQIDRSNQQRYINVNVYTDTADLSTVSEKVFDIINNYSFPSGYSYDEGGLYEQMIEVFGDLFLALIVSILLVYMVLASQFESLTLPFIVMISIPFAMSGSFLILFLTGKTLSITSFVGLILLVGIVVNNSILIVEFIKQNMEIMDRDQAIIVAGKYRLRPILMTTLTTCVGMIPLSLGLGDGGEMLSPLGISIIGGLISSTVITLVLVPVLYSIMDDSKRKRLEKKKIRQQEIQALIEEWNEEF